MAKKLEITIKKDGKVEFNQEGYPGNECQGDIDNILTALGQVTETKDKDNIYQKQQYITGKNTIG